MFWVFVDRTAMTRGVVTIRGEQARHLAHVLRVRRGEHGVAIWDSREHDLEVLEVLVANGARVLGLVLNERPAQGEPTTAVTLLQAVLPNPDFDAVIEGGTAVGINSFVAVQAARSVARPAPTRLARWGAIAQSAAEQSHRGRIPAVIGPFPLAAALAQVTGTRLLVLDPAASIPLPQAMDASRNYAIAVGPEGGWTAEELEAFDRCGATRVSLGPRVLRARLAPIVAAAILVQ